ncbi:hypothetical protein Tco_0343977 [Tanacetum coccineum]
MWGGEDSIDCLSFIVKSLLQESSKYSSNELEEHNVLRSTRNGFCVYDSRGLDFTRIGECLDEVTRWMTDGVNYDCYGVDLTDVYKAIFARDFNDYLGIPVTTGAYDIVCLTEQGILPEEADPATYFALTEAIYRAILQSDRTHSPKKTYKDWFIDILSLVMCSLAYFFAMLSRIFQEWGDKNKIVMAAPVIYISSNVSVKSVGSSFPRVILIGSISVEVPVEPEVGAAAFASPAGVLELDTHSSSKADPSENDLESDTEIPERHVSTTPHEAMLTRWRSRVSLRSSSPSTSILEIPTAPILPIPSAIVAPSSEPCRALTVRKSVRRLPSHHLALRYTSHHLDHFTSGSSSSHSSSNHSSFGHSILGYSLSEHKPPDTTDVDSSTPPRFFHPSFARTPRCTKAYLRWRSAPLSTMYPPTTSESLAGDSSSESSARSSRKRYRSPTTTITSSIHATRALVPSRANLLPPRKRFRDSISLEDSVEEDIETDVLADIEADPTTVEVAVDRDVKAGVNAGIGIEVDVGVDVEDEVEDEVESSDRGTIKVGVDVVAGIDILDGMLMPDAVEYLEHVEEGLQDIYEHVIEIPLQRIEDIDCWWSKS